MVLEKDKTYNDKKQIGGVPEFMYPAKYVDKRTEVDDCLENGQLFKIDQFIFHTGKERVYKIKEIIQIIREYNENENDIFYEFKFEKEKEENTNIFRIIKSVTIDDKSIDVEQLDNYMFNKCNGESIDGEIFSDDGIALIGSFQSFYYQYVFTYDYKNQENDIKYLELLNDNDLEKDGFNFIFKSVNNPITPDPSLLKLLISLFRVNKENYKNYLKDELNIKTENFMMIDYVLYLPIIIMDSIKFSDKMEFSDNLSEFFGIFNKYEDDELIYAIKQADDKKTKNEIKKFIQSFKTKYKSSLDAETLNRLIEYVKSKKSFLDYDNEDYNEILTKEYGLPINEKKKEAKEAAKEAAEEAAAKAKAAKAKAAKDKAAKDKAEAAAKDKAEAEAAKAEKEKKEKKEKEEKAAKAEAAKAEAAKIKITKKYNEIIDKTFIFYNVKTEMKTELKKKVEEATTIKELNDIEKNFQNTIDNRKQIFFFRKKGGRKTKRNSTSSRSLTKRYYPKKIRRYTNRQKKQKRK
jgi:hypothetical protein